MFNRTFSEFEEGFIRSDSNLNRLQKKCILSNIIKLHEYDKNISRILVACFDYISDEYKIYIPTNDDFAIAKVNEMGIKFYLDFDEDYIRELESLFLDDNYEFKYYDIYYLKNLCNADLKDIKTKYPNIRISTIRNVLMYIDKDKLDEIFTFLNDKSDDFQINYCKLITPVVIDVTTDKGIYCYDIFTGCLLNEDRFCPYNHYDDLNVYEYVWKYDSECKNLNDTYYKTNNTKYIECFNTYFYELLNKYKDVLDDKLIEFLCRIKECSLNHIPEVTGSIVRENIYETVSYYGGDDDREAACCPGSYLVYEEKKVGEKNVSTLDFKEREFSKIKELIENIFKMFIDGNIDYKRLMEYGENGLILDILSIFDKGMVLEYGN